ncbi:hypothetical protein BCR32DRAFT_292721 [Anaeromyces robustus]|uniref:Uncharacterized protein n=1 Tax=Anaeromyces robustus TaxID=1754192 RepID=A0A1Y1X9C6_9FUNG|nr:hypothetical protein BCR32DRAFT_292721 [Anaeromyces robustus]|eukprot:ORX82328.1 hypothetical protein BCR32DRAFT_292721 [Anaeromyces robustus]
MKQQQQRTSVNNDKTRHSRYLMAYGIGGYLLCFIADIILEYLPNGELDWKGKDDYELLKKVIEGATGERFALSGVLGLVSMIFVTLGLVGISEYINMYSKIASEIMLVGGVGSSVLSGGFHLICTIIPWIFVSFNFTKEAFEVKNKFYEDHSLILKINPIFYMLFCFTLLYVIVAGKTPLPRWACIFNIAFIFKALDYFEVNGASNIAGFIMSLGLFILTGIYSSKNKNNKKKE